MPTLSSPVMSQGAPFHSTSEHIRNRVELFRHSQDHGLCIMNECSPFRVVLHGMSFQVLLRGGGGICYLSIQMGRSFYFICQCFHKLPRIICDSDIYVTFLGTFYILIHVHFNV